VNLTHFLLFMMPVGGLLIAAFVLFLDRRERRSHDSKKAR
jgi:cytochrome c-type biogenesis protein CcmH/NrfF